MPIGLAMLRPQAHRPPSTRLRCFLEPRRNRRRRPRGLPAGKARRELQIEIKLVGRRHEHAQAFGHDFLADAITGDNDNSMDAHDALRVLDLPRGPCKTSGRHEEITIAYGDRLLGIGLIGGDADIGTRLPSLTICIVAWVSCSLPLRS